MSSWKFVIVLLLGLLLLPPESPDYFYFLILPTAALWFWFRALLKSDAEPPRYINMRGYVVLSQVNELEHRYIAKQKLGRNLRQNEIVHHINGKKTDNDIENLCLMDRKKHEFFHAWLRWKKEKEGRYPSINYQKKVLVEEYGGILLEDLPSLELIDSTEQVLNKTEKSSATSLTEAQLIEMRKKLFNELREERRKLAAERNVPAYIVFDDNTLKEISEIMPDSESQLLQVRGVGTVKLQLYGPHFLNVVKNFKNDFNIDGSNKTDSA